MLGFKGKSSHKIGFAFTEEIKMIWLNTDDVGLQIIYYALIHQKENVYGNLLYVNLCVSESRGTKEKASLLLFRNDYS